MNPRREAALNDERAHRLPHATCQVGMFAKGMAYRLGVNMLFVSDAENYELLKIVQIAISSEL